MSAPANQTVQVRVEGGLGRASLNRPGALNALDTPMCQALIHALLAWRRDQAVQAVLIDHAGARGFCAGGDIRMLARSGAGDGADARDFFRSEYQLNALLFSYPKPVIAIMDGVTMGGGAGLAMPARYRIATENTLFAMPEAGIGLFPDVGAGWWLPRLPGASGLWLALTGARLKAADSCALGIATHFTAQDRLPALKAALAAAPGQIEAVLDDFAGDPGPSGLAAISADLDTCFDAASVEAIFAALAAHPGAWAYEQLGALRLRSPTTLKVAFRQLSLGARRARFAEEMAVEYALACRIVAGPDFIEGVRAVLIDKDGAPRWNPATVEGVSEARLDALFAPLPPDQAWAPLDPSLENTA